MKGLLKDWFHRLQFLNGHRICDQLYWMSLADRFVGKPAFVIGNGPSLTMSDLDAIKGALSIASNKIYLAFEDTCWRPTFYTVADALMWKEIKGHVFDHVDIVHVPDNFLFTPNRRRTRFWTNLGYTQSGGDTALVSSNALNGLFGSYTVTFENLQLALHLGADPIYLIGCDHSYGAEYLEGSGNKVKVQGNTSHFHPQYRSKGDIVCATSIEEMEIGYKAIRSFAERNSRRVYNASRGGALEVFERADIDDVIANL